MADEVLALDENGRSVAGGVTNNVAKEIRNILVDPITGRLLVDANISLDASDIQIGAVEIKDGASDVRQTVLDLTNSNPAATAIVDANGDQITSFGGGVQYTEGDTDASITGTALLWEDGSNTLRAASAAKPFPVEIIAGAGSGGTAAADDADFTAGTTSGTPAMGVYESSPTSVTDGDLGTVGITQGRRLKTSSIIESSALPAGAATSAKQDTIISHVDGIEALLATIDADTSNLSVVGGGTEATAIRVTIANDSTGLVSIDDNGGNISIDDGGNTITVDGTVAVTHAALTELAAAINSNLVDVNIVSGSASGVQYTEDVAAAADPVGTALNLIRKDTLAALTTTDGDNVAARGTDKGELYVKHVDTIAVTQSGTWDEVGINDSGNSITVDNGGTFVTQENGAALTALQLIDDTVFVLGTATYTEAATKGNLAAAVRRDADTTLVDTTNEVAPLIVDARGALKVEAFSGETLPVSLASVPSHAVTNAGTFVTQIDGAALTALQLIDNLVLAEDAAHQTTDPGIQMLAVRDDTLDVRSGAENDYEPLHTNANGALWAIDVNSAAMLTALQLIDDTVFTDDTSTHATGTTKGNLIMAAAAPTDTAVNANDIGAVGMTVNRELYVSLITALPAGSAAIGKLAANSGVDIGDVDILSIIPGTGATNLGKAEDAGHTSADVGVFNLGVRVDTPNTALTNTDADYSALTTNKLGSLRTAALEDDLATAATKHVKKYYTNAGAVTDGIIWSPAAGARWFLTTLVINVSAAATVTIEDDVAAGDVVVAKFELAANSGVIIPFPVPMFSGEDAADLMITTSAGNVYVTAVGYEI